jgi:hypothetical protein
MEIVQNHLIGQDNTFYIPAKHHTQIQISYVERGVIRSSKCEKIQFRSPAFKLQTSNFKLQTSNFAYSDDLGVVVGAEWTMG